MWNVLLFTDVCAVLNCTLLPSYLGKQPLMNAYTTGPYQFHLVTFHGEA